MIVSVSSITSYCDRIFDDEVDVGDRASGDGVMWRIVFVYLQKP
ncbi:hypothetical protein [Fortiea sp. LEGE XX443]|nr:hypothetical protein [Fortiea sp. LEGE XX443]